MTAVPVVLALSSALYYGTGDFLGGEGSRRSSPAQMSVLVQGTGLVAAVIAVAITAHGSPPAAVMKWGALAGVGSAIGNQALYRGLASGAMNVVAPLSAVLTAVLPAIVGLAGGDRLSLAGWAGLVIAIPAIGLVSLSPSEPSSNHLARASAQSAVRSGVGWGLLAGCGFGLLFVGLDKAGTSSGAWPLLSDQIVAFLLVGTVTTYLRRRARANAHQSTPWSRALIWGLASGLGGAGGNICFFAATGAGSLTVVAVLSALYPAITVLLAAVVLHERTGRIQLIGLVISAAAVALISST
jgi:drug/metabolite transporter (DMT)-like permease